MESLLRMCGGAAAGGTVCRAPHGGRHVLSVGPGPWGDFDHGS